MRVRGGHASDAAAIARVGAASWWATYPPLLGAPRVAAAVAARYTAARVARWLEEARRRPDADLLVAEAGGRVVGFLHATPGGGGARLLERLYVHPAAVGRSAGRALLAAWEARLPPGTRYRLTVAAGNRRARAFYVAAGLEEAAREFPPFAVVMERRVPPRAPGRP